jgi:hypothetical protein
LVSGHYPSGPGEVAETSGVASAFHLKLGDLWREGGTKRRVVGTVQNPQSLLDEFALVVPGQLSAPTQVTALFDGRGVSLGSFGSGVQVETPASIAASNPINPETISLSIPKCSPRETTHSTAVRAVPLRNAGPSAVRQILTVTARTSTQGSADHERQDDPSDRGGADMVTFAGVDQFDDPYHAEYGRNASRGILLHATRPHLPHYEKCHDGGADQDVD